MESSDYIRFLAAASAATTARRLELERRQEL